MNEAELERILAPHQSNGMDGDLHLCACGRLYGQWWKHLAEVVAAALSRPVPDDTASKHTDGCWRNCGRFPCRCDCHKTKSEFHGYHPQPVPVTEGVDLEAIEARANAATDGPWEYDHGGWDDYEPGLYPQVLNLSHGDTIVQFDLGSRAHNEATSTWAADAEFIAAARTDIPTLVAEVRALRSRLSPPTREELARAFFDRYAASIGSAVTFATASERMKRSAYDAADIALSVFSSTPEGADR